MKNIVIAAVVATVILALVGCAEPQIIILAGETVCTSVDAVECKRLAAVASELHTPEMNAAIAAARTQ